MHWRKLLVLFVPKNMPYIFENKDKNSFAHSRKEMCSFSWKTETQTNHTKKHNTHITHLKKIKQTLTRHQKKFIFLILSTDHYSRFLTFNLVIFNFSKNVIWSGWGNCVDNYIFGTKLWKNIMKFFGKSFRCKMKKSSWRFKASFFNK